MRTSAYMLASLVFSLGACDAGGFVPPMRDVGPPVEEDAGSNPMDSGPPTPGVDAGPRPDVGPPFDGGCNQTTPLEAEIVGDPPDMLIVADISSSMLGPIITIPPTFPFTTQWEVMRPALEDVVNAWERRINFGLQVFPESSECGSSGFPVDIAPLNAAAITSGLAANGPFPEAATPTHVALQETLTYFNGRAVNPIGRYALLATDGLPNCNPTVDDSGVGPSITAIEALRAAGINTYVLGFGGGFTGGGGTLQQMATAGGTGTPYEADDATSLATALNAIAAEVIVPSCTVQIGGITRNPDLMQVRLDGTLIPRNTSRTSGWDYDMATNTITLYGSECDDVEQGRVADVAVDFGCPGPLI